MAEAAKTRFNLPAAFTNRRKAHKKTRRSVAEAIGYSEQIIFRWEHGLSEPGITACVALADYYNITLDEMVGRRPMHNGDQRHGL